MTMYGADADELDRLASEFRLTADDIDAEVRTLSSFLNNISWLGDMAVRFAGTWSGTQLPRIGLSTRFLRQAADNLSAQASAQRDASAGGSSQGTSPGSSLPGRSDRVMTPAEEIEQNFVRQEAAMREYLNRLSPNDPFRVAAEHRLDQGYRVYYFDAAAGHLAWSSGNLATASNVVVTVPGTGATLTNITTGMGAVADQYIGNDTAVITTLTWTPPPGLFDNAALHHYETTISTGPTGEILQSLYESGRDVVLTGHSAGGAAVQHLLVTNPSLVKYIDGVALLAPAEYDAGLPAVMDGKPILIAVHSDDPIQLAHLDDIGAVISVGLNDNVLLVGMESGKNNLPSGLGAIEDALDFNGIEAHNESTYAENHSEYVDKLFPGTEQLPDGLVKQRFVDSDGRVNEVITTTF